MVDTPAPLPDDLPVPVDDGAAEAAARLGLGFEQVLDWLRAAA